MSRKLPPPEKRKEIASKGGKALKALGRGHSFTSETGRAAGKKGGRPKKNPG